MRRRHKNDLANFFGPARCMKLRQKEQWKDTDAIDLNLHHSKLKPLVDLFDDETIEADFEEIDEKQEKTLN